MSGCWCWGVGIYLLTNQRDSVPTESTVFDESQRPLCWLDYVFSLKRLMDTTYQGKRQHDYRLSDNDVIRDLSDVYPAFGAMCREKAAVPFEPQKLKEMLRLLDTCDAEVLKYLDQLRVTGAADYVTRAVCRELVVATSPAHRRDFIDMVVADGENAAASGVKPSHAADLARKAKSLGYG
jgi:hypothetical protein